MEKLKVEVHAIVTHMAENSLVMKNGNLRHIPKFKSSEDLTKSNEVPYHLFLIVKRQIKVGEFCLNPSSGVLAVAGDNIKLFDGYFPVMATTSPRSYSSCSCALQSPEKGCEKSFWPLCKIPIVSTEFIEEYCREPFTEAEMVLKDSYPLIDSNGFVVTINKKSVFGKSEMFDNMQYYMEYCQANGYITPEEWLETKKHF